MSIISVPMITGSGYLTINIYFTLSTYVWSLGSLEECLCSFQKAALYQRVNLPQRLRWLWYYCTVMLAWLVFPSSVWKKWSFQEAVMKSLSLFSSSLCHWMFLNMVGFEAILAFFELLDTWKTHADFTMPFGLRCDTHWRRPSAAPAGSIFRIEYGWKFGLL